MSAADSLTDVKPWIFSAAILAFFVGDMGSWVPDALVVVLILQITASMIGIRLDPKEMRKDIRRIVLCIVFCFGVNTGLTLAIAYAFPSDDFGLFCGWVMVAAVPCAVSCVTVALTMYGNRVLSVLGLTGVYLVSLAITPAITAALIGNAVPTVEIFKYIVLFVVVPLIAVIPLNRLNIGKTPRAVFINAMMFILVILSIGRNSEYITSSLDIVGWIVVFAIVRTFVLSGILVPAMRKYGFHRSDAIVYNSMAVWKNTGLATSMCLILIPDMPQAAVPCAVCLLVESLWYAVANGRINRYWPPEISASAR